MNIDHLPEVYSRFRAAFPDVVGAIDVVGAASDTAGPLSEKERRLVKLGIAVGAQCGAVQRPPRRRRRGDEGGDPSRRRARGGHRGPVRDRCRLRLGYGGLRND
ncbi:MAG: hypothetical protein AAB198_04260 [Actinomycetota bacterium]